MSSAVGAGNFKETSQKSCDCVLKTGSAGCCYIIERDCCETKDEVLILAALIILGSAYMCLIKLDFHPPDCSFSHSSTFCSSHSSQAVYDSNGDVVEGGKSWITLSQLISCVSARKLSRKALNLLQPGCKGRGCSHLYLLSHLQTKERSRSSKFCLLRSERFLLKWKVLSVPSPRQKTNIGI